MSATPNTPDIQTLLDASGAPQDVKANAWDAYHQTGNQQDFQTRFDKLQIPQETKASLWDMKFSPQASAAPSSPAIPPIPALQAAHGATAQAKPGPYVTKLAPQEEQQFQSWVKQNNVPWQDSPTADYDMRGFWKAAQAGDPNAQQAANSHFPDTYKTPYHKTFSNESKYATSSAPHWDGDRLIDSSGKVIADETLQKLVGK